MQIIFLLVMYTQNQIYLKSSKKNIFAYKEGISRKSYFSTILLAIIFRNIAYYLIRFCKDAQHYAAKTVSLMRILRLIFNFNSYHYW